MSENKIETMEDYKDLLEASYRRVKEGDFLTGTVIHISDDAVTLDLKSYTEGIIKVEDLSNDPNFIASESLKLGDEITAKVIRTDDGEGHIMLSVKEANDVLSWDKLSEYLNNQTRLSVKISEAVNKGVVAYLEGIRGFIPASRLDVEYVEDTSSWVGKTVEVVVNTVDKAASKLVLSAKEAALEKFNEENSKKVAKVAVGSVMEGVVESIKDFGAFIRLENGLSGLLHISQICEKRIKSPRAVLKEGETVKVKIISTEGGKISLSIKALQDVAEVSEEVLDYEMPESEKIGTGLAALLKNLKL